MECKNILELPKLQGVMLSTEDNIFVTLNKEKSATKGELTNYIGAVYTDISKNINRMEDKGFVVRRIKDKTNYYALTASGVYEMQYRFNYMVFYGLHDKLLSLGYNMDHIQRFIRNRLYAYYLDDDFDYHNLEEQYLSWCESNEIDPVESNTRKLV